MVRQIAQHIGQETKYAAINPIQPLMLIGVEEGPGGYFSGLVPNIMAGLLAVWGTAALSYGVKQAFKYIVNVSRSFHHFQQNFRRRRTTKTQSSANSLQ